MRISVLIPQDPLSVSSVFSCEMILNARAPAWLHPSLSLCKKASILAWTRCHRLIQSFFCTTNYITKLLAECRKSFPPPPPPPPRTHPRITRCICRCGYTHTHKETRNKSLRKSVVKRPSIPLHLFQFSPNSFQNCLVQLVFANC